MNARADSEFIRSSFVLSKSASPAPSPATSVSVSDVFALRVELCAGGVVWRAKSAQLMWCVCWELAKDRDPVLRVEMC